MEYIVYWETTEKSERIESGVEAFHLEDTNPSVTNINWKTLCRVSTAHNLPISHIRIDRIENEQGVYYENWR